MKKLLTLAVLVTLSILLFLAVFSVVRRPLVVGEIQKNLDYKLAYARTLGSPKMVIIAGSNGRYSHRCEMFTATLTRPCVNASIGVGIGLDFLLEQWRPLLRPGDLVYMPLEYSQYGFTRAEMHGGLQNALLVQSQRDYLWSLEARRIAAAYGSFDLPFLIHGIGETLLSSAGVRRRSSTDSLTPQGDEKGHTPALGEAYKAFLQKSVAAAVNIPARSDAMGVVESFLEDAKRKGVVVVGGLPTVPDSVPVSDSDISRLRQLYESKGHRLVVLPNHSRYPLNCFFDTLYHLNEECQIGHSSALAKQLSSSGH